MQQLLKMREELKQREAELQKSSEDKQQLKTQVQNLKEGLQKLQSAQATQVSVKTASHSDRIASEQREGRHKILHLEYFFNPLGVRP